MREKELRDQIKKECLNYKTNFFGIGTLMRLEHNYYIAQRDNDYSFEVAQPNMIVQNILLNCVILKRAALILQQKIVKDVGDMH